MHWIRSILSNNTAANVIICNILERRTQNSFQNTLRCTNQPQHQQPIVTFILKKKTLFTWTKTLDLSQLCAGFCFFSLQFCACNLNIKSWNRVYTLPWSKLKWIVWYCWSTKRPQTRRAQHTQRLFCINYCDVRNKLTRDTWER